jgi:hypothetical protein
MEYDDICDNEDCPYWLLCDKLYKDENCIYYDDNGDDN